MINLSDCIELGTLVRNHGIHGQLVLQLNNLTSEEINGMEWVFVIQDGLPVPFFVTEFSQKNAEQLVLTLDDINSELNTKELIDSQVFIESRFVSQTAEPRLHASILLGYEVIDIHHGRLGILEDILDYQLNPLFQIKDQFREILLPIQAEFIQKIDEKKRQIIVDTPDGLTDLF